MIHQYKLGGFPIVLDTCSGAVHVVDDIAYEIIAQFEQMEKEALIDSVYQRFSGQAGVTREEISACYREIEE